MVMETWLNRTFNLIGKDSLDKISSSNILVIGIGGVGSFCVEGLIRSGVKNITLIDNDIIDITNINRQIMADTTTVNKFKVDVMKERILKINPIAKITTYKEFISEKNVFNYITKEYDYVIDCVDSVSSKIAIIKTSDALNIPIISSMGTGNKLDPTKFEISDIYNTSICPLARVVRKELKKINISHLKVLFSKEEPIKSLNSSSSPSSISFVPSVGGLIIASEVIKDLL